MDRMCQSRYISPSLFFHFSSGRRSTVCKLEPTIVRLGSLGGDNCLAVEIVAPLSDMVSVTTFALFFLRLSLFAYYKDFPARSGIRTRYNLISKPPLPLSEA